MDEHTADRRHGLGRRAFLATTATGILLVAACSLKPAENTGVQIKLVRPAAEAGSFSLPWNLADDAFSALSSTPTSLSDLNCFAVNVRGGSIPTENGCSGSIQTGIVNGAFEGINSTFQPLVPVSDGLVFEAYGMQASGCPSLADAAARRNVNVPTVYRIGSIVANVGTDTSTVNIPVAFNTSGQLNCDGGQTDPGLVTLFSEPFTYSNGELGNIAGTANWVKATGTSGLNISSNQIQPIQGFQCANFRTSTADSTKAFTRISLNASISGLPSGNTELLLTYVNNVSTSPVQALGCKLSHGSALVSSSLTVGGSASSLAPGSGGTALTATGPVSSPFTLSCSLTRSGSTVTVYGTVTFTGGSLEKSVTLTNPCSSGACDIPGIVSFVPSGSPPFVGSYDDFRIEQASSPQ